MIQKFTGCILLVTLLSVASAQPRWHSLFNGKDLSGWKSLNGHARYEVHNGEIIGITVPGEPNSFLATTSDYGDFILELEFLANDSLNSGIQFRSESNEAYNHGRVHGYQMEIDPSARAWSGGIYDEARRNWLYPMEYNTPAKKAYRHGQWNKYRIECIGPVMRTWVNGVPCANLVDGMTPKGFIALQVHQVSKPEEGGRRIRFRNIRIQTDHLSPSPPDSIFVVDLLPNHLSLQEKTNGVRLLWNGENTEGWRGYGKPAFPSKGWNTRNGAFTVEGNGKDEPGGGDVISDKEYGAFDLQFEFRITEGANSGVKYFIAEKGGSAIGPEYQVLDDERHPDAKLGAGGNRKQASLYDLIPAMQIPASQKKPGEWNQGRIVVYPDNHIEHWLNGYKVLDYQRGTQYFYALVARSKFEKVQGFGMAPQGHILLQDHGNEVSFRSIKIKELK